MAPLELLLHVYLKYNTLKIIDIHTHLGNYNIYHPDYLYGMVKDSGINISKEKFLNFSKIFLNDNDATKLLKTMNDAGVEKSILLIVDSEIGLGEYGISLEDIYEAHSIVLQKHPDRFIVFAGVDPRRKDAIDFVKKGFFQYNFRGVKLYPSFGFNMDHPNLIPVYKFCESNRLPVLFHTGPSIDLLNDNNFSAPENILTIAQKFSCNFILAHAGFRLGNPKINKLLDLDNIYFDISGFQSLYDYNEENLKELALIFDKKYSNKILFGSDWPLFHTLSPLKKDIDFLSELFKSISLSNSNTNIDPSAISKIMYLNSKKILDL